MRCRSLAPLPMMYLVRPTEAPELSGGTASLTPDFIFAANSAGDTKAVIAVVPVLEHNGHRRAT